MYNNFRTDLLIELSRNFDTETIGKILKAVDIASSKYAFTIAKNELVTTDKSNETTVSTYLMVKRMEGLSENTIKNYSYALKNFFDYFPKSFENITANDIRVYLYAYKADRNCSDRSLDKTREYICRFFHWCKAEGYIERDPSDTVKPIKHEVKERSFLTQEELERIREACETLREKCVVEVLYSTGCRISELANAKLSDINLDAGEIYLFGKGKKHRTSYLNAKAVIAIKKYLETRNDDCEYLIISSIKPIKGITRSSLEKIIKTLASRAGLDWVTPHIFRHSTATQALNGGMPVQEVQKLLGHERIDTTMIYAKVIDDSVRNSHKKYIV